MKRDKGKTFTQTIHSDDQLCFKAYSPFSLKHLQYQSAVLNIKESSSP